MLTVEASTADNFATTLETQSQQFSTMGENKISSLGISIIEMTTPIGILLGFVHFLAIALATGSLLLTLLRIIKEDDPSGRGKGKKELPLKLIILFIAVVGIPWAKKIIAMI